MSRVAKNALFTAPKVPGIYMPANRFMENPILFARFSDMNPHEESLFGWADEYGRGDFIFSPHEPKDEREWRLERLDLSFAVMLWEMMLKDDTKLNGIIEWNEDERRAYVRPFPRDKLDAIDFGREKDERYYPHYVLPRREIQNYRPETFDAKTAAARYIGRRYAGRRGSFP